MQRAKWAVVSCLALSVAVVAVFAWPLVAYRHWPIKPWPQDARPLRPIIVHTARPDVKCFVDPFQPAYTAQNLAFNCYRVLHDISLPPGWPICMGYIKVCDEVVSATYGRAPVEWITPRVNDPPVPSPLYLLQGGPDRYCWSKTYRLFEPLYGESDTLEGALAQLGDYYAELYTWHCLEMAINRPEPDGPPFAQLAKSLYEQQPVRAARWRNLIYADLVKYRRRIGKPPMPSSQPVARQPQ
jgi:hypothetical protein